MSAKPKLTEDAAWKNLQDYFASNGPKLNIRSMFDEDKERFTRFR